MTYNILLVEDDDNIRNLVNAYLEKENFNTYLAMDGQEAIDIFNENKNSINLIILDLMIPKISGEDVCKIIRKDSNIPIIMLTAKTSEDDKIDGLTMGADDYITKPFSPRELITRVKVLIRRVYGDSNPNILSFNSKDLEISIDRMVAKKMDLPVELTTNEFKVLVTLASNPNNVLSREQIINITFGEDYDGYDRTIDTYIKNIRHKIENDPKNPDYIETVYGAGYRFKKQKD